MNNYFINEKVAEGERNKNKSHCIAEGCGCVLEKGEGYAIWIPSRGKRYVCRNHYNSNGILSYHGNANARRNSNNVIGTDKKLPLTKTTIGTEIEVVKNSLTDEEFASMRTLLERCFLVKMESDCTVSGEFPTEKMQGLATISKVLQSLESHNQLDALRNESCGAHIHCYCNDVAYVRRYYHSIFLPLARYIEAMGKEKRLEVFGSDFREWAQMIDEYTNPTRHENMFNTQHEHTLEFRLPRITSHKQYMQVLKFWREVVFTINGFDFDENNSSNHIRTTNAKKCGDELAKIAKKYF